MRTSGLPSSVRPAWRGTTALFIQGVGAHGAGWRPQVDDLASNFTCLTFDNRGMARSQPAGVQITLEQMAEDALAILDTERLDSAHLVGHSLGGLAAIYVALSNRARVLSLTLMCTFAAGAAAAPLSLRLLWWGMRSRIGSRDMRRRGFLGLLWPPNANRSAISVEQLNELFGHDISDQPPIAAQQLYAMRHADASSRLSSLGQIPTLVMSATHDPIAPPVAGRMLRDRIPGARYVEVDEASHGLPIAHPSIVNLLLTRHLAAAEQSHS